MTDKHELLALAMAETEKLEDGSWPEDELTEHLAGHIFIDVEAERHRIAKRIIDGETKLHSTKAAGQLNLPGFGPYPNEPLRLIRDDQGRIIVQAEATPEFKAAEARRADKNAADALHHARVKNRESNLFSAWAAGEAARGRPALELTWGIFIVETGILASGGDAAEDEVA